MNKPFTSAIVVLALNAAVLSPSTAQNNDQTGTTMGMMGGGCPTMMGMMGRGMMGQGSMSGGQAGMGALAEGRLAYLKGALNITDAQNEAWNGYAEAVKGQVKIMQGMRSSMMDVMQKGGAVERMDVRISGMEAMLGALKSIKPATEKLYSVLSADQKKVADQLIGVDCGAM